MNGSLTKAQRHEVFSLGRRLNWVGWAQRVFWLESLWESWLCALVGFVRGLSICWVTELVLTKARSICTIADKTEWAESTSVSTTGTLETTWKSEMPQELIILSDFSVSVADDTEVVPPTSKKQIQRPQHRSMPSPLIDDEPFFCLLQADIKAL